MARTRQKVTGAIIVICNLPVFLSVTASPCRQKKTCLYTFIILQTHSCPRKNVMNQWPFFLSGRRRKKNLSLRLRPVERFSPPVWFIHLIQLGRTHQVYGHIKKQDVQSKPRILLKVYLFSKTEVIQPFTLRNLLRVVLTYTHRYATLQGRLLMPHHHSVGLSALPVGKSAYGRSQMSGDQRHPHHQSLSRCPEVGHAMSLKNLCRDFVKSPCQEQITDLTNLTCQIELS